jgi:serine/threonine-protein phosphatase 2A regulatory subunit B'
VLCRERQHAVDKYEGWKTLRVRARANATGGHLPEGFEKDEPVPPPPAPADDSDILDLALDLNAVSIDGEIPHEWEENGGIERVPTADPGLDVSGVPSLHIA